MTLDSPIDMSGENGANLNVIGTLTLNTSFGLGGDAIPWYDLQLMAWGDGSAVPTGGQNLVIAGLDDGGLLHIRTFDANDATETDAYEAMEGGTLHLLSADGSGNILSDTPESSLSTAQTQAITDLKLQIPGLLPPHVLTYAEDVQLLGEASSITDKSLPALVPSLQTGSEPSIAPGNEATTAYLNFVGDATLQGSGNIYLPDEAGGGLTQSVVAPGDTAILTIANGIRVFGQDGIIGHGGADYGIVNHGDLSANTHHGVSDPVYGGLWIALGAHGQNESDGIIEAGENSLYIGWNGDTVTTSQLIPAGSELQLISWGDGSTVPTSELSLVIAGLDDGGLLHIRTFDSNGNFTDTYEEMEGGTLDLLSADSSGNVQSDVPESSLSAAQLQAITALKQQIPGLLPPNVVTYDQDVQLLDEASTVTGQRPPSNLTWANDATFGIVGTLVNTGAVFSPPSFDPVTLLDGGTIVGGNIGGTYFVTNGTFDGVTLGFGTSVGSFTPAVVHVGAFEDGDVLTVLDGLSVSASSQILLGDPIDASTDGTLLFQAGSQSLTAVPDYPGGPLVNRINAYSVVFGASTRNIITNLTGTLTLAGITIGGGNGILAAGSGSIDNQGTIAESFGGTVDIEGPWSNDSGYLEAFEGTLTSSTAPSNLVAGTLTGGSYFIDAGHLSFGPPGVIPVTTVDGLSIDLDGPNSVFSNLSTLQTIDQATGLTVRFGAILNTLSLTNNGSIDLIVARDSECHGKLQR